MYLRAQTIRKQINTATNLECWFRKLTECKVNFYYLKKTKQNSKTKHHSAFVTPWWWKLRSSSFQKVCFHMFFMLNRFLLPFLISLANQREDWPIKFASSRSKCNSFKWHNSYYCIQLHSFPHNHIKAPLVKNLCTLILLK